MPGVSSFALAQRSARRWENAGRHHILIDAVDQAGRPQTDPAFTVEWSIDGLQTADGRPDAYHEKFAAVPGNLAAVSVPMFGGDVWVRLVAEGLSSDRVRKLTLGSGRQHRSFYVVFQRTLAARTP